MSYSPISENGDAGRHRQEHDHDPEDEVADRCREVVVQQRQR
jgi:hypothetical protein